MRVVVLTTDTIHHIYFVSKINELDIDVSVICEKPKKVNYQELYLSSFESQKRIFDEKRDEYEISRWFESKSIEMSIFKNYFEVNDVNSEKSIQIIKQLEPDVIIVFGTGKIKETLINNFKKNIFNLHGGNPEKYRGLDSHYWSIYHNDFDNLVTTLHEVSLDLDTGDIVSQGKLKFWPDMKLYQLRASNTELCVELFKSLTDNLKKNKKINTRKQSSKGRYYSIMPEVLKVDIKNKFNKFISQNFNV
jgi:methionyl-tRNA formyltransferase